MKTNNYIAEMKKWIILILVAVVSYWGLNNLDIIIGLISRVFRVFLPFILGGVLAFILNIPMTRIENFLKSHIKGKKSSGGVRIISIVLSLLIFLIILLFIAFLLIPELIENVELLINNIPGVIDKVEVFVLDLLEKYPDIQKQISEMFSGAGNISEVISNLLNYFVNGAIGFISSLVSGFITFFTGIIFSIYMLSQKEYLLKGTKKLIYAFVDEKKADKILEIGDLSNKTFSKFISGQCVEAVILGSIMFIFCLLFRFPYALIIAVLTTVTALVPIFGAMIAMVIGAILIGITNPIQALLFIVVFQVVQQIEGNFIYPRVVGKSVGLSPMWTLLAITVGGSLFGIVGMLLGLPFASVASVIVKSFVYDKLKDKKVKV